MFMSLSLPIYISLFFVLNRHYQRNDRGCLINAPYVDNSYKWAGGGLLSNAEDLVHFGNIMLHSYQATEQEGTPFLKASSVAALWDPHPLTFEKDPSRGYGMGWVVVPANKPVPGTVQAPAVFSHTGGAIGGSSVVLIQPEQGAAQPAGVRGARGVVVAMICNLESVGMEPAAQEIALLFSEVAAKKRKERP